MERDPVCGMQVDPRQCAHTGEYHGQTYYFCSERCQRQFDQNPALYAGQETGQPHVPGHGPQDLSDA